MKQRYWALFNNKGQLLKYKSLFLIYSSRDEARARGAEADDYHATHEINISVPKPKKRK